MNYGHGSLRPGFFCFTRSRSFNIGFSMISCGHLAEEHTSAIYIMGAWEPGRTAPAAADPGRLAKISRLIYDPGWTGAEKRCKMAVSENGSGPTPMGRELIVCL